MVSHSYCCLLQETDGAVTDRICIALPRIERISSPQVLCNIMHFYCGAVFHTSSQSKTGTSIQPMKNQSKCPTECRNAKYIQAVIIHSDHAMQCRRCFRSSNIKCEQKWYMKQKSQNTNTNPASVQKLSLRLLSKEIVEDAPDSLQRLHTVFALEEVVPPGTS